MFDFIAKMFKLGRHAESRQRKCNEQAVDGTSALALDATTANSVQSQGPQVPPEDPESGFNVWTDSRLRREMKATRAGAAYWQAGTSKYKRRQRDDQDLKTFYGYFDALKENNELRTSEFENPGTGLAYQASSLINNSIRDKMIGQYVARSQKAINAMVNGIPASELDISQVRQDCSSQSPLETEPIQAMPMFSGVDPTFQDLSALMGELCQLSSSLSALARSCDEDMKCMLAEYSTLPGELFEILGADENLDIKYRIAENYACPVHVLVTLAEDENPYVAHRAKKTLCRLHESGVEIPALRLQPIESAQAAERINISDIWNEPQQATMKPHWERPVQMHETEQLSQLFEVDQDGIGETYNNWLWHLAEAANTKSIEQSVSTDVIWMLIDDPNADVRFCLAENYNIDEEMLEKLAQDENPYVAHRANKTLTRLRPTKVVDKDFRARADERRKTG